MKDAEEADSRLIFLCMENPGHYFAFDTSENQIFAFASMFGGFESANQ